MEKTATAGDDGAGFDWLLVNLHGQVKDREGSQVILQVLSQVLKFFLGEVVFMFLDPVGEEAF